MRPARRHLLALALVLVPVALSLIGGVLALRAVGEREYRTTHARVSAQVLPAREPSAELRVPLLDWGVRVQPFDAPVAVRLVVEDVDRDRLVRSVESPDRARRELELLQRDGSRTVRRALRRAAIVWMAGGLAGGLVGGALVGAALHRRRWLLGGTVAGGVVTGAALALVMASLASYDPAALDRPQFTGRADELEQLVGFSTGLLDAGDAYESHYATAVASISNAAGIAREGIDEPASERLLLASDIHNNALVLDSVARVADGAPVLLAGDFGQLGSRFEEAIAPRIGRLGEPVVAVSGNHDSRAFMAALEQAGVDVRDKGDAQLELAGLGLVGYDDPLEGQSPGIRTRVLTLDRAARRAEQAQFVEWFDALPEQPDAVLVHQHGLAHALAEEVSGRQQDAADGDWRPRLVLLTGHDHRAHVERVGDVLVVDGGTLGAGGPAAIGEQPASFAVLRLRGGSVEAVDLVSVEPVSGAASARRVVVSALAAGERVEPAAS